MAYTNPQGDGADINFWPSFTDLTLMIILVLVVFFFAQVIANTDAFVLKRIETKQDNVRELIVAQLDDETLQDIAFSKDFKAQRITFSNRILFASGRADIQPRGIAVLDAIGQILLEHHELYDNIQIEGHTDSVRVSPGGPFRSNWDLSSSRATAVVEFFDNMGMDPARIPISAAGFSKYRPVDPDTSEAALARNRRIEMIIFYNAD